MSSLKAQCISELFDHDLTTEKGLEAVQSDIDDFYFRIGGQLGSYLKFQCAQHYANTGECLSMREMARTRKDYARFEIAIDDIDTDFGRFRPALKYETFRELSGKTDQEDPVLFRVFEYARGWYDDDYTAELMECEFVEFPTLNEMEEAVALRYMVKLMA
jgi:hypothetical protein